MAKKDLRSIIRRTIIVWIVSASLLATVLPASAQTAGYSLPAGVELVIASPVEAGVIYAAVGNTVYRSVDSGQTWLTLAALPSRVTALLPANRTPALLYAATESGGILRSLDGGQAWQPINQGLGLLPGTILEVSALSLDPDDDSLIYAATGYWLGSTEVHFSPVAILASLDGGANWLGIAALPLSSQRVIDLAAVAGQPLTVEARAANGEVQRYAARAETLSALLADPQATPAQRAAAAQALGVLGDQTAVPVLAAAIDSGDVLVVNRAAEALGTLRAAEAIPALQAALLAEDALAPGAAAHALAGIATPEAMAVLVAALDSDPMTPARHAAMSALEEAGSLAVPALLAVTAGNRSAAQRNAVELLGWIGDPAAVDALVTALQSEDAAVRAQAAWALGELAIPSAGEALARAAAEDVDADVRLQATQALARLPAPLPVAAAEPAAPAAAQAPPARVSETSVGSSSSGASNLLTMLMPTLRWVLLAAVLGLAALLPWYQNVREQRRRRRN